MDPHSLFGELEQIAAAARAEMRAEAEEAEREAATLAAMRRRLEDVFRELMSHGDRVAVTTGRWTFAGRVVHVAAGLASLALPGARLDLNLGVPLVLRVLERPPAGGRSASPAEAPSLRARLLELQGHLRGGAACEVGTTVLEETLAGSIAVVGTDHLVLRAHDGGEEWFVPLSSLAFVRVAEEQWR